MKLFFIEKKNKIKRKKMKEELTKKGEIVG